MGHGGDNKLKTELLWIFFFKYNLNIFCLLMINEYNNCKTIETKNKINFIQITVNQKKVNKNQCLVKTIIA